MEHPAGGPFHYNAAVGDLSAQACADRRSGDRQAGDWPSSKTMRRRGPPRSLYFLPPRLTWRLSSFPRHAADRPDSGAGRAVSCSASPWRAPRLPLIAEHVPAVADHRGDEAPVQICGLRPADQAQRHGNPAARNMEPQQAAGRSGAPWPGRISAEFTGPGQPGRPMARGVVAACSSPRRNSDTPWRGRPRRFFRLRRGTDRCSAGRLALRMMMATLGRGAGFHRAVDGAAGGTRGPVPVPGGRADTPMGSGQDFDAGGGRQQVAAALRPRGSGPRDSA